MREYIAWNSFDLNVYLQIRKSKAYVSGIWVNKVLGIRKGYYRVKKNPLVSWMKPWTEARNNNKYMKSHPKLTYQISYWNVSRNIDYHAGGKWLIHGPKRRKENQLLSHGFAIKRLKYGISWRIRSTAHTVLDELFPYLTQMIIAWGGVLHIMTIDLDLYLQGYLAVTPI